MKDYQCQMLVDTIRKFGSCRITVEGFSMWPYICSGDSVVLVPPRQSPEIGEVAAFFNDNQLILHRIIFRRKNDRGAYNVWLRGDFYPHSMVKLPYSNIFAITNEIQTTKWRRYFISSMLFKYLIILIGWVLGYLNLFYSSIKGFFCRLFLSI